VHLDKFPFHVLEGGGPSDTEAIVRARIEKSMPGVKVKSVDPPERSRSFELSRNKKLVLRLIAKEGRLSSVSMYGNARTEQGVRLGTRFADLHRMANGKLLCPSYGPDGVRCKADPASRIEYQFDIPKWPAKSGWTPNLGTMRGTRINAIYWQERDVP
jgi:hypothetical protein